MPCLCFGVFMSIMYVIIKQLLLISDHKLLNRTYKVGGAYKVANKAIASLCRATSERLSCGG